MFCQVLVMIVPLWSTSPVHRDIVLTLQVFSVCFLGEKKKKIDGDHLIMVYTIISRSPPLSRHHAINTSPILILELLTSKTLLITTSNLLSYHRRRLNITSLLLKWLLPFSFCILAQEHLQIIAAEDYETAV